MKGPATTTENFKKDLGSDKTKPEILINFGILLKFLKVISEASQHSISSVDFRACSTSLRFVRSEIIVCSIRQREMI